MTEQDYINVQALGTIKAALGVLRDLDPENLKDIILDGEQKKVTGTLHDWYDRLREVINTEEEVVSNQRFKCKKNDTCATECMDCVASRLHPKTYKVTGTTVPRNVAFEIDGKKHWTYEEWREVK